MSENKKYRASFIYVYCMNDVYLKIHTWSIRTSREREREELPERERQRETDRQIDRELELEKLQYSGIVAFGPFWT